MGGSAPFFFHQRLLPSAGFCFFHQLIFYFILTLHFLRQPKMSEKVFHKKYNMKKAILIGLGISAILGIAYAVAGGCCGICTPGCCPFC